MKTFLVTVIAGTDLHQYDAIAASSIDALQDAIARFADAARISVKLKEIKS